jgi:hypothetical protein
LDRAEARRLPERRREVEEERPAAVLMVGLARQWRHLVMRLEPLVLLVQAQAPGLPRHGRLLALVVLVASRPQQDSAAGYLGRSLRWKGPS